MSNLKNKAFAESYSLPAGAAGAQHRFHRLWAWLPNSIKRDPAVQRLFVEESEKLDEHLRKITGNKDLPPGLVSRDRKFLTALTGDILKVAATHPFRANEVEVSVREGGRTTTVKIVEGALERSHINPLIALDPTLVITALERYVERLPTLSKAMHGSQKDRAKVLSLRNQMLALTGTLLRHPDLTKQTQEELAAIDAKVDLSLPAADRFLLLPPLVIDNPEGRSKWAFTPNQGQGFSGSPLFPSSLNWLNRPQEYFTSMKDFIAFLDKTEPEWFELRVSRADRGTTVSDEPYRLSRQDSRWSFPHDEAHGARLPIPGFFSWVDYALRQFPLTLGDVQQIVDIDTFWRKPLLAYNFTGTFYDDAAYRLSPREVEPIQVHLYKAARASGKMTPEQEVALWGKMADRTFTPLTDRWAEDLRREKAAALTPRQTPFWGTYCP